MSHELPEAIMEHYTELLDAERRALSYQEFIAHTLVFYGERMPSWWKEQARTLHGEKP